MSGDARIAKPSMEREAVKGLRAWRIAYFGHDAGDAAIRRRVRAFEDDGAAVTGFMMRRGDAQTTEWKNIDLGRTADGAFLQRIRQVFSGAATAAMQHEELASADVIVARNLDMLACAFLAKRKAKLDTPVIYESLDVHRLLCRQDLIGKALRWLEGRLLRRTKGLIVSSPAFLENHFERYYPDQYRAFLVENRLAAGAEYGPRPVPEMPEADRPLRLGWVGVLRCQRSFDLLCDLADRFPDTLEVHLHGVPARTEIPVFEPEVSKHPNMIYHGRYKSPEDLSELYGHLDMVWAGDFMEAGFNSVWLLPNRIYEGGYYCVPAIAPAETQTAAWISSRQGGFSIQEPLNETLPALIAGLIENRAPLLACARALAECPEQDFVQPAGMLSGVVESVLEGSDAS
ncbi:putative glycosyl transferase [Hyphomonas adhaerens MHS-3]|uniref:Putative glycosyl transferase n=1 Tax=Hyphomonas adhaerens MHS-3 TaxID=1280949 RepID=A0A069E9Q2_9PROT|nr:glycosyl transferase [Hyphomonas adhaerens]KCZ86276.1 putative glycosyl transferase [Hyphomonas adhaerens MHS-3]